MSVRLLEQLPLAYAYIKFYLIACQPALPRLACLKNHSVWFRLVVDVRMIAVAEIFSTRLSHANLYTQFARLVTIVGGKLT